MNDESKHFHITGWEAGLTFIPNTWKPAAAGGSLFTITFNGFVGSLLSLHYDFVLRDLEFDVLYLRQFWNKVSGV